MTYPPRVWRAPGARHMPMRRGGVLALVRAGAIACCLLSVQGCAALPNFKREQAVTPPEPVAFETAKGPVSDARSEGVLDRLDRGGDDSDILRKHLAYEEAINVGSPLVLGNRVTLLQNGPATYKAMFAAIRAAKDHINLETYIFSDDEIGQQFAGLLLERQAAGVQVNVIYDSVGSLATPAAFFERLRAGGVRILEFNPVNPLTGGDASWRLNNRDHRKLLIVDGRTAFLGGINISATYASSPSGSLRRSAKPAAASATQGWRDTHLQVQGPVVAEFQKLFMQTWVRQKAEPLAARNYFPPFAEPGGTPGGEIVRAIASTPDDPQSLIYLTLMSAITHAERTVHLTVAYFAPDQQLLVALTDAARRGVEVKLLLPGYSDSSAIFHLGRSKYTQLLRGGVRIYERRGSVMHAKTACVDGVWSTIGSTNLDWRSFLHNDEINAVILGHGFAAQMEAVFADDLRNADQVTLKQWRRRPLVWRLKEQLARIAAYWL